MTRHNVAPLGKDDLVFCDFDGTISKIDTGIAVIDALDLDEAWEVEHVWRAGKISSMECMSRQWGMVKLPEPQLYALLDTFELHDDFGQFVTFLQQREAYMVVVSDGLDFYIDYLLGREGYTTCDGNKVLERRHDCIPRFANHALLGTDGIEVQYPHRTDVCSRCGNCKLAHLMRFRPHFRRVIYVGDGFSDMCPAKYADFLFAKDHLAEAAARDGMRFLPFDSFGDIIKALE